MKAGILITQCLQKDFVKPIGKFDPLPNLLHVGYSESFRLMGEDFRHSPVNLVIQWAGSIPEEELHIIHIRDWHDPSDPAQTPHLEQFGPHCLKNSEGAEFVFAEHLGERKNQHIINASGLNDFIDTGLQEVLDRFKEYEEVRIGIMGVWTEAKVFFLAYDLITRYPAFTVGVCSALTAGSSRSMHFVALDQLKNILGVKIFPSIGAFTSFLAGSMPVIAKKSGSVELILEREIAETDRQIASYLFRGSREAELKSLDGGFSGNLVLKARSMDHLGHREVPTVVKIGPRDQVGKERVAFERIQEVMGNNAPNIVDYVEIDERGGIKYRYASMIDGKVSTFQDFYESGGPMEQVEEFLETVFVRQLGRLYEAGDIEKLDLLKYYDFNPRYAPSVKRNIENLPGVRLFEESIEILPGVKVPNVVNFYSSELLARSLPYSEQHYMAYLHGDLNGKNIIIDSQANVWLIDFFHTHRGHILRDLIKMENDLLFIFTKIQSEEELKEAFRLSDALYSTSDLWAFPGEDLLMSFSSPALKRAFYAVKKLRSFYPPLIRSDRSPYQLFAGMLRYTMHTLSFEESSVLQKKWALYTGALCSRQLTDTLTQASALRIDYVDMTNHFGSTRLGITILPGRKDRLRDLSEDIAVLRSENISRVAILITAEELTFYGVEELLHRYREAGLEVYHFPILDQKAPLPGIESDKLLNWMYEGLSAGKNTVIHCVGGLGRSGMIGAAFLKKKLNLTPPEAIRRIREIRSNRAIETPEQENFVYHC